MTWRELPGAGLGPTPDNMNKCLHTELSSHEGTRSEFNPSKAVIKLGIDVHQEFYVVVLQEGGGNPKPAQRFKKEAFLSWAAKLKQRSDAQIHAVYEACGFGFGLQRQLAALHLLVYEIKDATMVLSFAYLDEPGGDQLDYAGCSRLLILKAGKWSEIKGPESLAGKGWAVRQSVKNNYELGMRVWMRAGAEGSNMGSGGNDGFVLGCGVGTSLRRLSCRSLNPKAGWMHLSVVGATSDEIGEAEVEMVGALESLSRIECKQLLRPPSVRPPTLSRRVRRRCRSVIRRQ